MANKVRFGLSNVHYSLISDNEGSITFATPVAWRGAVSLTVDVQADTNKFYADNGVWASFDSATGGTATLEMADVPESVYTDLLGFVKIAATGEIVENTTPISQEFALLFEVSGNTDPIGYRLYRCTLSRPGLSANTTNESTDPETSSFTLTYMPIENGNVHTIKSHQVLDTAAKKTAFYESVALPNIPSA